MISNGKKLRKWKKFWVENFFEVFEDLCILFLIRMSDKERLIFKENRLRLNTRKYFLRLEG